MLKRTSGTKLSTLSSVSFDAAIYGVNVTTGVEAVLTLIIIPIMPIYVLALTPIVGFAKRKHG